MTVSARGSPDIEAIARRVRKLPPQLQAVLGCMSNGMSPAQIAEKLGYANARTINSLVSTIYGELGLRRVESRTEKRTLAINAFKKRFTEVITIDDPPPLRSLLYSKAIELHGQLQKMASLFRRGYELEAIEIRLRKPA
jgi:hypothetical protein